MRTQEQILARINTVEPEDLLGFGRDVLLEALDFAHAKPFLKPETTADQWSGFLSRDAIAVAAQDYLAFAFGKAKDHRGLSAGRSVQKLAEFAWLLERDDVVAAMEAAEYRNYGVPKLVVCATGFGWPIPSGPELQNMAQGRPCQPGCGEGCGS